MTVLLEERREEVVRMFVGEQSQAARSGVMRQSTAELCYLGTRVGKHMVVIEQAETERGYVCGRDGSGGHQDQPSSAVSMDPRGKGLEEEPTKKRTPKPTSASGALFAV